jgi:hypothetical protein
VHISIYYLPSINNLPDYLCLSSILSIHLSIIYLFIYLSPIYRLLWNCLYLCLFASRSVCMQIITIHICTYIYLSSAHVSIFTYLNLTYVATASLKASLHVSLHHIPGSLRPGKSLYGNIHFFFCYAFYSLFYDVLLLIKKNAMSLKPNFDPLTFCLF